MKSELISFGKATLAVVVGVLIANQIQDRLISRIGA